jgi:hypothetical protein
MFGQVYKPLLQSRDLGDVSCNGGDAFTEESPRRQADNMRVELKAW